MERLDKSALSSKKFLAFLFAEVGFFILMGMMLAEEGISSLSENAAFMVLAITAGVLACSYIGGQALVDRYVRVATIMASPSKKDGDSSS